MSDLATRRHRQLGIVEEAPVLERKLEESAIYAMGEDRSPVYRRCPWLRPTDYGPSMYRFFVGRSLAARVFGAPPQRLFHGKREMWDQLADALEDT